MIEFIKNAAIIIAGMIAWFLFIYLTAAVFGRAWFTEKRISMGIWNSEVEINESECENYKEKEKTDV